MERSHKLIGASEAMRVLRTDLQSAARSDGKVLLTGESGVGKEIAAQMIHELSGRARNPLVTINCAGMPDTLLESELFGHHRGSFTDAYKDKRGWLEQANGGTVFMDELGEMSLRMQALLLRFLETGEIQRLGSERLKTTVNVRVVAATNRHLMERIAAKEFREDLYYRLNVIHIVIPPLRERRDDIPLLLSHFLNTIARAHGTPPPDLSPAVLERLTAHEWPGNVRELKNVVERMVVRCSGAVVQIDDLPLELRTRSFATVSAEKKGDAAPPAPGPARAGAIYDRIVKGGENFWNAAYEPFMARDLTRDELRTIVCNGLSETRGSYRVLVDMFNMPPSDYRRFLSFLRKYECHLPFEGFRMLHVRPNATNSHRGVA